MSIVVGIEEFIFFLQVKSLVRVLVSFLASGFYSNITQENAYRFSRVYIYISITHS